MSQVIIPSVLSSVHLVPEGTIVGPSQRRFLERAWYRETLVKGESRMRYFQKVENDDILTIQFDATTDRPMKLDLYGAGISSWVTVNATVVTVTDKTYTAPGGTAQQLYTHTATISPSGVANLPAGIYWLRAQFEWEINPGTVGVTYAYQYAISEPLHIRPRWERTVRIDCRHNENNNHFTWLGTGTIVSFRVDARLSEGSLDSTDQTHEDSLQNHFLLSSDVSASWQLETLPVPAWLRLKIHHALSCKQVLIEGRPLTKAGGKVEAAEGSQPLRKVTATLYETAGAAAWATEFAGAGLIGNAQLVYSYPGSWPYMLHTLRFLRADGDIAFMTGRAVPSQIWDSAILDELNGARFGGARLYGQFKAMSGGVYYIPHPLERAITPQSLVLPKSFQITTSLLGAASTTTLTAKSVTFGAQWDPGNVVGSVAGDAGASLATRTLSHTYPNPGAGVTDNRSALLFYRDDAGFSFQELHIGGDRVLSVSGSSPAGLKKFSATGGIMAAFDCAFLYPSYTTLEFLSVSANQLTTFTNYAKAWTALNFIRLINNKLSSATVDAVIIQTQANLNSLSFTILSGNLQLNGQTPPAPRSSASNSAKTDLVDNRLWTVLTDPNLTGTMDPAPGSSF